MKVNIKPTKTSKVAFSKPFIAEDNAGNVVLITGEGKDDYHYSGYMIRNNYNHFAPFEYFSKEWVKYSFSAFLGKIEIDCP